MSEPLDPAVFRQAMGRVVHGVSVLTTVAGGQDHAMTADTVTSVSLEPLLVLCCAETESRYHDAVLEAQEMGIGMVRAGANGRDIHEAIQRRFEAGGYPTRSRNGKMEGFFHGTGHGVGLDIHEAPRVGGVDDPLPEGSVVTVEPGLYYAGVGGVRIEDMVLVRKGGCRNLTEFPKSLQP